MDVVDQKTVVFGKTIGLVGALASLHEELKLDPTNEQPKSEQLQCYHLDLKPQNMLVFVVNGNDIWKTTAFDISRNQDSTARSTRFCVGTLAGKIHQTEEEYGHPGLESRMHDLGGHMPLPRLGK